MSEGLARLPGHRSVEGAARETDGLLEILPFLPTDYQAAVPLYISMALLFIVVSRAARRKTKVRLRKRPRKRKADRAPVARRKAQPVETHRLRPHQGYWGDG